MAPPPRYWGVSLLGITLAAVFQAATASLPSILSGDLMGRMASAGEFSATATGEQVPDSGSSFPALSDTGHLRGQEASDVQHEGEDEDEDEDDADVAYRKPRPIAPGLPQVKEEVDLDAHEEASRRHKHRLERILIRARTKPRRGKRMSFTEALARAGDGRIYVVGNPEGPPLAQSNARGIDELSGRHLAAVEGTADVSRMASQQKQGSSEVGSDAVGLASQADAARLSGGSIEGRMDQADTIDVSITVQTKINNFKISPYIYGVNEYGYKSYEELQAAIKDAGIRFVRRGGNIDTRWNWFFDTRNSAADWYFQNYPQAQKGSMSSLDQLFQMTKDSGAESLFTVPVLGWLPKARDRSCSFSIKKYGEQKSFDPWATDCGNGQLANGTSIRWNDVRDTAALYGPDHQKAFMQSVVGKWGKASAGGVKFYCLDNEPVWWSYVHWDIKKAPSTYNEILERGITYAAVIKSVDPTALVLGPVSGGWSDVFFSITDMQNGWGTKPWKYFSNPVDRRRHGDVPHLQWYLENFKAYENAYGTRLLDIVDIHGYVAGSAGNQASDPVTQANRIATTRVYWDPTFNCGTTLCDWIDPITAPEGVPKFLVRVQEMIDKAYPGLGLALTEYTFGGDNDVSGAIAQAETLGIFGKLGLTIATVFSGPRKETSVYKAFKMYGNYDSNGGQFGDLGVSAVSSSPRAVSCYAAINSARKVLTVLVINLTPTSKGVSINFADIAPTQPIRFFRFDASNLAAIVQMPSLDPSQLLTYRFTGYSMNMLEVALP